MGVEKQVNRRVADSRHDVQESFTVEHRLHEKSLPVVWRKEWGFCLLGQTMICGRIAIGRDRWELCSYATRFVLRLVTESACICWDAGISLFELRYALDSPMSYKGHGLSVSLVEVQRLMRHEPKQAKIDEHERGITMSKKNIATASTMTAAEFKQKSYDAYLAYVEFIEGKKSIIETVEALSPLLSAYGFALNVDNLANLLTVKMTAYGKDKGEQAKKVKSISTFRAFVKGGWKDVQNAPVHSNAGKNPADAKVKSTTKKPTKAELEAEIAALRAKLEAATTEEKAA